MKLMSREKMKERDVIKAIIIVLVVLTLFRIVLSNLLGMWFPTSTFDDELLLNYADFSYHFEVYTRLSLAKTMSYAVFLNFVNLTMLPYTVISALLWAVAALVTVKLMKLVTDNKWFLAFVYLFVLYTPIAFDAYGGTRLYRNSIIAPFVLILFDIILIILFRILIKKEQVNKKFVFINFVLGTIFTFTYYIKEDGIWLLAVLLFVTLIDIAVVIIYSIIDKNGFKPIAKAVAILAIPVVIFAAGTAGYKMVNYIYFGVYEIETRTSGEYAEFINNIYKIDSENRTSTVWAPTDAIEKAFEVSETLSEYPELLIAILETPWFGGDIYENPIYGDFLSWVLSDAMATDVGMWESEAFVQEFFAKVNAELEEAFETGLLEEDDKFQLVSSSGGYSTEEIYSLVPDVISILKIHITYSNYDEGGLLSTSTNDAMYEVAEAYTNMNLKPAEYRTVEMQQSSLNLGNKITSVVFFIYKIISPLLVVIGFMGAFITFCKFIMDLKKKRKLCLPDITYVITMCGVTSIAVLYAFAISWFCKFRGSLNGLKFYSVGVVPLITLAQLLGLYLFIKHATEFIQKRKAKKANEIKK